MPETFAKLSERFSSLPPDKRRLVVICSVGLLLIGIVFGLDSSEEQTANPPAVPKAVVPNQQSAQTAMPQIIQPPDGKVRDPFAPPPGFEYKKPEPPSPTGVTGPLPPSPELPKESVTEVLPTLNGIITGGGEKVAILSHNGISRSYQAGQVVGAYEIIAIRDKSVTVEGPEGQRILTIGR